MGNPGFKGEAAAAAAAAAAATMALDEHYREDCVSRLQESYAAPGPPSSHSPSLANRHLSVQPPASPGGRGATLRRHSRHMRTIRMTLLISGPHQAGPPKALCPEVRRRAATTCGACHNAQRTMILLP